MNPKFARHFSTGSDEQILRWLRCNLDVIRLPAMTSMLNLLAQQKRASTSNGEVEEVETSFPWGKLIRQLKARMKLPRGGLSGGGSMQTMLEVPLPRTDAAAVAEKMFRGWPVKAGESDLCWECNTMAEC